MSGWGQMKRPVGVTILAIIAIIAGIAGFALGLRALGLANAGAGASASAIAIGIPGVNTTNLVFILGVVFLVLGVIYVSVGIGLWLLEPWARTLGIILMIGDLALRGWQITHSPSSPTQIGGVVLDLVVLVYLLSPGVRDAFDGY